MKWLIAVCAVLIALGVFVEPKKIKISGDDVTPIALEHRQPSWPAPPIVATGSLTTASSPTLTSTVKPGQIITPANCKVIDAYSGECLSRNLTSCTTNTSTQQTGCSTGLVR